MGEQKNGSENNSSFYAPQYGPFYAFAEGITGYATGLTSYVFTPYTVGLKQIDSKDSSITYTALASSSKDSVLKTNAANAKSYEKEKGDEEGPFDTVAAVTKTTEGNDSTEDEEKKKSDSSNETESNITSNILVFGSVYSLSDTMDTLVQGSNTQIVNNALKEYIDTDVTTISVPAKSLTSDTLTVTESGTRLFGILLAVVAPVIVLAAGIIVWVRRRKC